VRRIKDLRKYASQTHIRLIIGGILLFFVVGDGLILVFWGSGAAISGFLCLGMGLIPVILIVGALFLMDLILDAEKRRNQ
jgi:hypothetical protein